MANNFTMSPNITMPALKRGSVAPASNPFGSVSQFLSGDVKASNSYDPMGEARSFASVRNEIPFEKQTSNLPKKLAIPTSELLKRLTDEINGESFSVPSVPKDNSQNMMLGAQALSTGLGLYSTLGKIRAEEQTASNKLMEEHRNYEFAKRLESSNRSRQEFDRMLQVYDSMAQQGELGASGVQQQTFYRDPISGRRV